ncbi:reverse transcriptase domain-containing protein [Tanacetum coccineum]
MKKMYCLVGTDDYSRFSWVFFLATKDETSGILKSFITRVENLIDQRVKAEELILLVCCKIRVLVTKLHNKTPYELFLGRKPALGFMRPFGCHVTILNTIDHLGKFNGKADEGFFVGYSINSKAFRVFNSRTKIVEENLHVQFSKNTPNIAGSGPNWLFDIDALTKSMNYKPVIAGNQSNGNAGTKACDDAGKARMETVPGKDYILLPLWPADLPFSQNSKSSPDAGFKPSGDNEKKVTEEPGKEGGDSSNDQEKEDNVNNTNNVNAASTNEVNVVGAKTSIELLDDPNMPELEDIVYSDDDEDVGAEADMNNLNTFMLVSPIPTTRIHKDHPVEQIIGDLNSAPQTRRMTKNLEKEMIEAMHDELLQFKLQKVWTLVDLPNGKRPIGTKWVYRNKKDERVIVIMNKARLVAQGWISEVLSYGRLKRKLCWSNHQDLEESKTFLTKSPLGIEFEKMMHKKSQMSSMGELTFFLGLQVKQNEDRIFISQDKYMTEILKKFGFTDVKTASTPMETQKPLLKDEDGEEVDVYLYRSMIGSLMYLTSSRPDIMFVVCACARYQVNPKVSHLHVAYTYSDYARASLDRKSTTGGCQFLGCRLISWQCKKQTVVANSTTEAEYVAASSCCGQVLWIQNQLLDYGDSNEKKLIQMIKIHTDKNVADLLTKAFDVKTVNGEQQLQALVDGKKIVVAKASVRRDLQLDDEEGTDCLPNATIFEELTRMGAKTTAWNEFSSTIASAIICLATNQKFNFSKNIFESMVKNLDNADTFYNALNANDQDSLNSAAGGNFLDKMPRECLRIIESSKSKFVNSNTASSSSSGSLPSNTVTNPKEDLKGITTRSGVAYQGPTIPTSSPKVVERRTEVTKDTIFPTNNGITEDVQPSVVPVENQNQFWTVVLMKSGFSDMIAIADVFSGSSDDLTSSEVNAIPLMTQRGTNLYSSKLSLYKTAKSSIDEPLEVELKDLPPHLEYAFLEDNNKLPVIIAKDLSVDEKTALIKVLKSRKRAIAWKLSDIKGINPEFCSHKILMEEDYEPAVQHQRRVNPKIHDVIKKEVEKLLDAGLIYPISDSPWVSPVHCVPKKGGMTVVTNDENELVPTRLVTGWRVCIDYRKLNEATRKDHFPLPFMDQMLERLAGNEYYCFLDGFSGYFQIPIDPKDQEKTTFTCPYGTFAYRRMPFGLCNAPGTFQRCMMAIFHDMIEKTMEVFMDDFSVFGNSFSTCLSNLEKMLKRLDDALWAVRTAYKTLIGCTPYKLCRITVSWQRNELKSLCQAYANSLIYKEIDGKTKKFPRLKINNGIGVNAGDSKLMLLGINLPLLGKVNAHKLTAARERKVNAARHKLTAAGESTNIAKASRKQSKPDKHGHGNGKECTRAGRMLSKSTIGQH